LGESETKFRACVAVWTTSAQSNGGTHAHVTTDTVHPWESAARVSEHDLYT
jgi:hypothetical protein